MSSAPSTSSSTRVKRPSSDLTPDRSAPEDHASVSAAAVTAVGVKKRRGHKKVPKQHRVGNFRSYYNYRLGRQHETVGAETDPRLSVLEREWFAGKRGLDVGCNAGNLTIAIAKAFTPSYLMGVDVDPQLIAEARGNLKEIMQKQQVEDAFHAITTESTGGDAPVSAKIVAEDEKPPISPQDATEAADNQPEKNEKRTTETSGAAAAAKSFGEEMPLSFRLWKPPQPAKDKIPKALGKAAISTSFPYNVVFKREDVAKDNHAGKDYDFITCFSVTKWIHLFHGDDGLKQVFRNFYELLAPGGRLILEPQPWKSYHKRKFTSDVTIANYGAIQLRPKDFPAFLTDSVGFRSCTFLQVCQTSSKGFKRPIYVVEK